MESRKSFIIFHLTCSKIVIMNNFLIVLPKAFIESASAEALAFTRVRFIKKILDIFPWMIKMHGFSRFLETGGD